LADVLDNLVDNVFDRCSQTVASRTKMLHKNKTVEHALSIGLVPAFAN